MKVALVYDRLNKWGGAERVLLALHQIFPDAPLYTSVYDQKNAKWAGVFEVRTSFLQKLSWLRSRNDLLPLLMPFAFESFNFDEYDLVISITSEAAKGIITKPKTLHVCYCLTPTRYLWSAYDEYFRRGLFKLLSRPTISYLKSWDKVASSRPDYFIAISDEVQKRIKKYYGRETKIIYPPLMLDSKSKPVGKSRNDYFLLVSRFSRASYYKKVDLAIEAFSKNGLPFKIVGSGPMLSGLKSKAKGNIEFLGELTDEELARYYVNSRALIFPGREDFGLVMAEAQSFGVPVIAYKAGGALDIIEEGKTGEFFDSQTPESINSTLKRFDIKSYNKAYIMEKSERFSFEIFKSELLSLIDKKI